MSVVVAWPVELGAPFREMMDKAPFPAIAPKTSHPLLNRGSMLVNISRLPGEREHLSSILYMAGIKETTISVREPSDGCIRSIKQWHRLGEMHSQSPFWVVR
jgi:hypothetical protein